MTRFRLLIVSLALIGVVAACGGDDDDDDDGAAAEPGVVLVDDNQFKPDRVTVGVGDTVTWQFVGSSAHNIKAEEFESKLMKEGEFEFTFDEAGDFDYVCTVHPGMAGNVVVEDGAAP